MILVARAVDHGEWCDVCTLPSKVRVHLSGLFADEVLDLGSVTWCTDHSAWPEVEQLAHLDGT